MNTEFDCILHSAEIHNQLLADSFCNGYMVSEIETSIALLVFITFLKVK